MNSIPLVAGISLITPERLENLCAAAAMTYEIAGDLAELGVYRGGSALVLADLPHGKLLHLFDTFTGLPNTEHPSHNPTGHDLSKGRFACPESEVRLLLGNRHVAFHPGFFPESALGLEALKFSFIHVDCDIYQSATAAIDWFWPRLEPGGIMFFDDYGCEFTGVTEAVHESFQASTIIPQIERSNGIRIGCYVCKTK